MKLWYTDKTYRFGWIRLDVDSLAKFFIIKDYAYNNIPNAAMKAGEGIPSDILDNNHKVFFSLYANKQRILIDIPGIGNEKKIIQIFNVLGKEVLTRSTYNVMTEIDINNLKTGFYIIRIEVKNNIFSKILFLNQ
jgi:hypothetical protein